MSYNNEVYVVEKQDVKHDDLKLEPMTVRNRMIITSFQSSSSFFTWRHDDHVGVAYKTLRIEIHFYANSLFVSANYAIPLVPQFRPLDILAQLGKFPSASKKRNRTSDCFRWHIRMRMTRVNSEKIRVLQTRSITSDFLITSSDGQTLSDQILA